VRLLPACCAVALALPACVEVQPGSIGRSDWLVTCGGDEVRFYTSWRRRNLMPDRAWRARADPAVQRDRVGTFSTVAECKSVDAGKSLLIASSHDGVAILDIAHLSATFVSAVGHAHSGDVSTGGLVLIAGAEGERSGNRLVLFDRSDGDERLAELSLEAAHGVVFDPKREAFWALGAEELLLVKASGRPHPNLSVVRRVSLPSRVGHDLSWWSADKLSVTTDAGAYLFTPSSDQFIENRALGPGDHIKSVTRGKNGHVAYVRADDAPGGIWWSHRVNLIGSGSLMFDERVYKARFLQ